MTFSSLPIAALDDHRSYTNEAEISGGPSSTLCEKPPESMPESKPVLGFSA